MTPPTNNDIAAYVNLEAVLDYFEGPRLSTPQILVQTFGLNTATFMHQAAFLTVHKRKLQRAKGEAVDGWFDFPQRGKAASSDSLFKKLGSCQRPAYRSHFRIGV